MVGLGWPLSGGCCERSWPSQGTPAAADGRHWWESHRQMALESLACRETPHNTTSEHTIPSKGAWYIAFASCTSFLRVPPQNSISNMHQPPTPDFGMYGTYEVWITLVYSFTQNQMYLYIDALH